MATDNYTPLPVKTKTDGDIVIGATVVEDAASSGGEKSLLIAGVRNDAAVSKTSLDGDFGNIAVDAAGRVGIADLGGSITVDGTVTVIEAATVIEDAASSGGESSILIAGVRNDAAASKTSLDGDFSNIATDAAGRVGIADLGGSITVDGTVTATLGANVTEDAASSGGETSVLIAGVRNDAAVAKTNLDGDFGNIAIDSAGRVGITTLGSSINVNVGAPTSPQVTVITTVDVAPAASKVAQSHKGVAGDNAAAVNNQEIGAGVTGKLLSLILASTVGMKWELRTSTGAGPTLTDKGFVITTAANPTFVWELPNNGYVTVAGSASSNDGFEVVCTNLDPTLTAAAYVTFVYDLV